MLFFLAGANFWEKHAKNCAILFIFVYFLVLIFWREKLVCANFYAFSNYEVVMVTLMLTRNDYVPNPSSSYKYEVNVSVDDDDDDDDDMT